MEEEDGTGVVPGWDGDAAKWPTYVTETVLYVRSTPKLDRGSCAGRLLGKLSGTAWRAVEAYPYILTDSLGKENEITGDEIGISGKLVAGVVDLMKFLQKHCKVEPVGEAGQKHEKWHNIKRQRDESIEIDLDSEKEEETPASASTDHWWQWRHSVVFKTSLMEKGAEVGQLKGNKMFRPSRPGICATAGCKRQKEYEDGCVWDRCCKRCLVTEGGEHEPRCDKANNIGPAEVPIYCAACQMYTDGPRHFEDHKRGRKHKANTAAMKERAEAWWLLKRTGLNDMQESAAASSAGDKYDGNVLNSRSSDSRGDDDASESEEVQWVLDDDGTFARWYGYDHSDPDGPMEPEQRQLRHLDRLDDDCWRRRRSRKRDDSDAPVDLTQRCIDCQSGRCDRCGGWLHDDCVVGCTGSARRCAGGYCYVCEPRHHCHAQRRPVADELRGRAPGVDWYDMKSKDDQGVDNAMLFRHPSMLTACEIAVVPEQVKKLAKPPPKPNGKAAKGKGRGKTFGKTS